MRGVPPAGANSQSEVPLVCLGLSHHTAPLDVRERHAVPVSHLSEALRALKGYDAVREACMISTCNRMEIYAELVEYEAGVAQLKLFLQRVCHSDIEHLDSYLYTLLGPEAVRQLFRVATGIDSMLVGEAEILGQVKTAYLAAQQADSLGPTLHTLMRSALRIGKRARAQTGIGQASLSAATAAVDLVARRLGSLKQRRVVIVGAGKMALLIARRLRSLDVGEIAVVNRSEGRAAELIAAIGTGRFVALTDLEEALVDADVVLTAAGASTFLLSFATVAALMTRRPDHPLVIADIAVPRDVDPAVAVLPGVHVIDIDTLHDVVEDTLARRRLAIPLVERVVATETERFLHWYRMRPVLPLLTRVASHADRLQRREVQRLLRRCSHLNSRDRRLVVGMASRLLSEMTHGIFSRLRELGERDPALAFELANLLQVLHLIDPPTAESGMVERVREAVVSR